jgi:integrase
LLPTRLLIRTYKSASGLIDLAGLKGKIITQITDDDIRRIRDSIRARGKIAQSKLTMRTLKAMFGWLAETPASGLKINPTIHVATSVKSAPAMLADAIAAAEALESAEAEEEFSAEELRILEAELATVTPPSARLALQLALRTVQRRLTVVSALKASFRPHGEYGMVWWIHPGILKVGRTRTGQIRRHPHVIPLSAGTQEIVRTALSLTRPGNPYLFPQLRLRRAGDAGDGHLSERLLNAAVADLQKLGRPLHAAQQFSSHAFRAWFTTHMGRLGYSKSEIKTILDHSEGRLNNTTDMHYDLEQSLPKKLAILNAWQNLIDNNSTSDAWPLDIFGYQATYPTN